MKILLIILSGVCLVNNQPSKEQFEAITNKKVFAQGKVPVVAKKATTEAKKDVKKKKTTKKSTKKKTSQKKKKVKSAKKKVYKSKNKKKTTYKKTTRVRYNVGEIQSYAHSLVLSYGWTEEDYQYLVLLWNRESSWNPNAVNKKSGACGIPQSLPCSKMASEGADYRTNYRTQVRWGCKYIKARYGSPSNAWEHSQQKGWY
jgi:hypothetical protein